VLYPTSFPSLRFGWIRTAELAKAFFRLPLCNGFKFVRMRCQYWCREVFVGHSVFRQARLICMAFYVMFLGTEIFTKMACASHSAGRSAACQGSHWITRTGNKDSHMFLGWRSHLGTRKERLSFRMSFRCFMLRPSYPVIFVHGNTPSYLILNHAPFLRIIIYLSITARLANVAKFVFSN
jgi:hypothetical protein